MKIALASDHAGFTLKDEIKRLLEGQGHTIEDFGATSEAAVDLADHVYPAALAVGEGRADRGIFVDGVGYGSAMIANKIAGVYAAVCQDPFCAGSRPLTFRYQCALPRREDHRFGAGNRDRPHLDDD